MEMNNFGILYRRLLCFLFKKIIFFKNDNFQKRSFRFSFFLRLQESENDQFLLAAKKNIIHFLVTALN